MNNNNNNNVNKLNGNKNKFLDLYKKYNKSINSVEEINIIASLAILDKSVLKSIRDQLQLIASIKLCLFRIDMHDLLSSFSKHALNLREIHIVMVVFKLSDLSLLNKITDYELHGLDIIGN